MKKILSALLLVPIACGTISMGCSGSDSKSSGFSVVMSPLAGTSITPANEHQFYESRFTVASGGTAPYSFIEIAGGLPDGLFVVTTDGSGRVVSSGGFTDVVGFSTDSGTDAVLFQVFDSSLDTSNVNYTLTTTPAAGTQLALTPVSATTTAIGQVNVVYPAHRLTIGNGAPGYTWGIAYGALPPGLTLSVNPSGTNSAEADIVGTPTTPGSWIFAIEVRDSGTPVRYSGGVYQIDVQ